MMHVGTIRKGKAILRKDVYQSNALIQARKTFDIVGSKIFYVGLGGLNPHFSIKDKYYDLEFKQLFVPKAQLIEMFCVGNSSRYLRNFKKYCEKLSNAIIEFKNKDNKSVVFNIFQELYYVPKEGLYLQFGEKMRPYLLDLLYSNGFTRINISQFFYLSSTYAFRLLELMLQYQNIPTFKLSKEIVRDFEIEDFKFYLNIPQNAYKGRTNNLRKNVIEAPIAEINEKTIYKMSYNSIRQGSNLVGFEFHLDMRNVPLDAEKNEYGSQSIKILREIGFNLDAARKILNACDGEEDCLNRIMTAQKILMYQKKINPTSLNIHKLGLGFLRKAITENWQIPTESMPMANPMLYPIPPDELQNLTNFPEKETTFEESFGDNQTTEPISNQNENLPLKKELSETTIALVKDMLESPTQKKFVDAMLRSAGWTLNEFTNKYLN